MTQRILQFLVCTLIGAFITNEAMAAYGSSGAHSLGGSLIFASPSQDDIDTLISNANTTAGGISTKSLNQGYEFVIQYKYQFDRSMYSMLFRPSYFMQGSTGTSSSGAGYNYELSGFTFFPIFRLTPLENSFMKFYLQVGMGYGTLNGKIKESTNSVTFSGSNFGALTGLGAEFCFFSDHCLNLEGNFRYLPIQRNIASSVTGGGAWGAGSLTNPSQEGDEVELNDRDLATSMSGVLATIGYVYYF